MAVALILVENSALEVCFHFFIWGFLSLYSLILSSTSFIEQPYVTEVVQCVQCVSRALQNCYLICTSMGFMSSLPQPHPLLSSHPGVLVVTTFQNLKCLRMWSRATVKCSRNYSYFETCNHILLSLTSSPFPSIF